MCKLLWDFIEDNVNFVLLTGKDVLAADCKDNFAVLGLWAACYAHLLLVLDDIEIYEVQYPLQLSDIERVVKQIKVCDIRICMFVHHS